MFIYIQRWALDVIALWSLRGRLPHAVQASAQLIEIMLCDQERSSYSSSSLSTIGRSDIELRLMYSLAVIRAVNGLADAQQQGYFADSVLSLATGLGIPAWIVELRHDATHSELPPLGVLREASRVLIDWLHRNYWQAQSIHLDGIGHCAADVCCADNQDEELRAAMNTMTPSSYSHIIIPSFVDHVLQRETAAPTRQQRIHEILRSVAAFDKKQIALAFGGSAIWRAEIDALLGLGRSRLVDRGFVTEALLIRMVAALRDCMAVLGRTEREDSPQISLLEWHILVLVDMVSHVLDGLDAGRPGEMELLGSLLQSRSSLQGYLVPEGIKSSKLIESSPFVSVILPCISKMSTYFDEIAATRGSSRVTKRRLDGDQQQERRGRRNDTLSGREAASPVIRTHVLEPRVWPIGLLPGSLGSDHPLLLLTLKESAADGGGQP